jgi:hypothetical protein
MSFWHTVDMSRYEKEMILKDTRQMEFLRFAMVALFSFVLFFSLAIPALKDTYGIGPLFMTYTSSY